MATRTSVANGLYSADGTWDGVAPTSSEDVIIKHTVSVVGAAGAALSLLVESGTLTLASQTLTVTNNCYIGSAGAVTKIAAGTLAIGGDLHVEAGDGGFSPHVLTVTGQLHIVGRDCTIPTIAVSGLALIVGGTVGGVDASSGNQLIAYGSVNCCGNTNVVFQQARGRRVSLNTHRRGWVSGVAA